MESSNPVEDNKVETKQKAFVWQPMKPPPVWSELNPIDGWEVPAFTRSDLHTPLFQRRGKADWNTPCVFDHSKFGNQYLAVTDIECKGTQCKILLRIVERHMTTIRLICHKLKTAGSKIFLGEVHSMLSALLSSVRQFAKTYCAEAVTTFSQSKKRKKRGARSNLTVSKKSKRYRNLCLRWKNYKVSVHDPETIGNISSTMSLHTSHEHKPNDTLRQNENAVPVQQEEVALHSPPCSPIPKNNVTFAYDEGLNNISAANFTFLQDNVSMQEDQPTKINDSEATGHDSGYSFATPVDEAFLSIKGMLKEVLHKLDSCGLLQDFTRLIHAMFSGSILVNCLPLLLCYEVAKFKSLTSTTCMSYSGITLQFWRLLYKLLGGGVIRALSGPKNLRQVVTQEATRGRYDPVKAKINFAVPCEKVLCNTGMKSENFIPPGIITSTLDIVVAKAKEGKEFVLTFDSKLIGPGVARERDGDIDLWGFEVPNLERSLMQKKREINVMQSISNRDITDGQAMLSKLLHAWKIVSWRLKALRLYICDQHASKVKAQRQIQNNPDNAKKYTYRLSKINANIYLGQQAIKSALLFILSLTHTLAHLRKAAALYHSDIVQFGKQMNCFSLLPPVYVATLLDLSSKTEFIKQGTPDWLQLRQQARITGSTAYNAMGLRGLPSQKRHYDQFILGMSQPPPDAATKLRLEHGKKFEEHAVASICGCAAPAFLPNCYAFFDTGAHWIDTTLQEKLLEVSPDGYLECTNGSKCPNRSDAYHCGKIAVEIKCPFPREQDYMSQPHYEVPICYVPQLLLEMKVLGAAHLWYVSCTKLSTTIIDVKFDQQLLSKIIGTCEHLYGGDNPPYPATLNVNAKELKQAFKIYTKSKTKLLMEVPTVLGIQADMVAAESPYCCLEPLPSQQIDYQALTSASQELATEGSSLIHNIHNQLRRAATEVGVFMISDSDRIFDPDSGNSWPLGYILKGSKMDSVQLRGLFNKCLQLLHEHKVPVIAMCVDGQWSKLCFRDCQGKPLTRLCLQKDTWSIVGKRSKRSLLKLLGRATCPYPGDLDLLSVHQRGNPSSPKLINIAVMQTAGKLALATTGGIDFKWPIMRHIKTLDGQNKHWETDTTAAVSSSKRKEVYGLQPGESNLLSAIAPYFVKDILGLDAADCHGCYCFAELETVLKHHSFMLLDDIINALQQKNPNWEGYLRDDLFPLLLQDAELLLRECTVEELRCIACMLKKYTKRSWLQKDMVKYEIVNSIASAFGSDELIHGPKNRKKRINKHHSLQTPKSLASLCEAVILHDNYPTTAIRISIADGIHVPALKEWNSDTVTALRYCMPPNGDTLEIFSKPEYCSTRGKLELMTMDVTHMLTNLRTNVLKGKGFTFATKEHWQKVADAHPEIISRSIVYDNVDCQSAAFAKRVFSHAVESTMRENGDSAAADFVLHVRNWYAATDMRGIACHKRMEALHDFYRLLTRDVDFNLFPPPGAYIHGIPVLTYQAILQNICSRVQLFSISPKGSYNQRVVTTLSNESSFADMVHADKDGLGAPKAVNVPRIISKIAHLNEFKHKPNKPFLYHTSKKKVYPVQVTITEAQLQKSNEDEFFKEHLFDQVDINNPQTRKRRDDITRGAGPLKGVQGLRRFYKVQENLIPDEQRIGICSVPSLTNSDLDWLNVTETG